MGAHLIDGKFQSDKYPSTPRGKVPLSCGDKAAQGLLWVYAELHRPIDAEFSDDLQEALRLQGYRHDHPELIRQLLAIPPHPDVAEGKPLVLYFRTDADREEMIAAVTEAMPGARAVKL